MVKSFVRITAVILLIALSICLCFGCEEPAPKADKPALDTVIASYDEAQQKQTDSTYEVAFSFFDRNSVAGKITEKAQLTRTYDGGTFIVEGTLRTAAMNDGAKMVVDLINGLSGGNLAEVYTYLEGESFFAYQLGHKDGTYNAKGDYCLPEEEVDYCYIDSEGEAEPLFLGFNETDVQTMFDEFDYNGEDKIVIKDLIMTNVIFTLDWSKYLDAAPVAYNVGENAYLYTMTYPKEELKQFLVDTVEAAMEDLGDDAEIDYDELRLLYDTYKDMLLEWISFSDLKLDAKVSATGQLLSLSQSVSVMASVPDEDILYFCEQEEIDTDMVATALTFLHTIVSSSDGSKGRMDFQLDIKMNETYAYDVTLADSTDDILSLDTDTPEGRTFYVYAYDEEDESYRWQRRQ